MNAGGGELTRRQELHTHVGRRTLRSARQRAGLCRRAPVHRRPLQRQRAASAGRRACAAPRGVCGLGPATRDGKRLCRTRQPGRRLPPCGGGRRCRTRGRRAGRRLGGDQPAGAVQGRDGFGARRVCNGRFERRRRCPCPSRDGWGFGSLGPTRSSHAPLRKRFATRARRCRHRLRSSSDHQAGCVARPPAPARSTRRATPTTERC